MPEQLDIRAIRGEAKELLKRASVPPLRMTLAFLAVNLALSLVSTAATFSFGSKLELGAAELPFSFVSVLVSLLELVLTAGYTMYCLGAQRGREMPYTTLLDAFPAAGKVILLTLLQSVLIALGLMLFIVPGVVIAFCYSFALYHICEEPDAGVIEAMRRSRAEMRGYKAQYLLLLASFLPPLLLASLAVGACGTYLNKALPDTLGGNLLYTLATGVLSGCVEVWLLPYLTFAQIGFFRRATERAGADAPLDPPDYE